MDSFLSDEDLAKWWAQNPAFHAPMLILTNELGSAHSSDRSSDQQNFTVSMSMATMEIRASRFVAVYKQSDIEPDEPVAEQSFRTHATVSWF